MLFPFRVPVGDGNFPVQRIAIAIVLSHQLTQSGALLERNCRGITNHNQAIIAKAQGAGIEQGRKLRLKALHHAILNGLNGRRSQRDVGLLCVGIGDKERQQAQAWRGALRLKLGRLCIAGGGGLFRTDHFVDELTRRLLGLGGRKIDIDRDAGRHHDQQSEYACNYKFAQHGLLPLD